MLKSTFLAVVAACLLSFNLAYAADKINLNTASVEQLQTLDGVGPSTAAAIVSYRERNEGFGSVDELMSVKGIGDKKFEQLAGQLSVSE